MSNTDREILNLWATLAESEREEILRRLRERLYPCLVEQKERRVSLCLR